MFDLEQAIRKWKQGMAANPAMEEGYVAELEAHLRDRVEESSLKGMGPEESFQRAVAAMGGADEAGAEFFKAHTVRRSGRPPWQPPRFMPALLWNYLKVALRKMQKQKGYSFITIFGLAAGLACCIMIYLWTQDALGYNLFHKNAKDLYRIYFEVSLANGSSLIESKVSATPLARFVKTHCREALATARIATASDILVKINGKAYPDIQAGFVDPALLKMFSFEPVKGDLETALSGKFSCLLTEEASRRFFGDSDPIGQTLTVVQWDFQVAGIIRSFPRQSDYHLDMVCQFGIFMGPDWKDSDEKTNWGGNPLETFVQLRPGIRATALERSLNQAFSRSMEKNLGLKIRFGLQPLSRIHIENPQGEGLIRYVPLFSIAALFILFIACINFITLTTARSDNRAKEIGLRKVIGASRGNLIWQFFGESFIFALISLALAICLSYVLLPLFSRLVGETVSWNIRLNGNALWTLAAIVLVVGLMAGGYPALVMSGFHPLMALKASPRARSRGAVFQKALVVLQFSLAIALIFFTVAISRQLRFMEKKDLGFQREHIVCLKMDGAHSDSYEAFKGEILRHPGVGQVTRALENPALVNSSVMDGEWPGKDPQSRIAMNFMFVDLDFVETFRMRMASGRAFAKGFASDPKEAYLINETAATLMGMPNPVGQRIAIFKKPGTIVGVVKDFHFQPLNFSISPLVIGMDPGWFKTKVFVRIAPGGLQETLRALERSWKKFFPELSWSYEFFDAIYRNFYLDEDRMKNVAGFSATLAILISCLGLLALASFSAAQRTKEIGIRRVLGAPTNSLLLLLTKDFMKWVVLANLIALPLANFLARKWLLRFAYRLAPDGSTFMVSSVLSLTIALLTVGNQTIRTACANPVDSLRYE